MPERPVAELRKALAEYYATERSVREIYTDAGFDARVLYRCIDKNGLPRRSAIAAEEERRCKTGYSCQKQL